MYIYFHQNLPPRVYICNVMLYTNRLAVSANYFSVYRIYLCLRAVGSGKGGGGNGGGGEGRGGGGLSALHAIHRQTFLQ